MRLAVLLALLILPAGAAELGFKEVFDPFHPAFPDTGARLKTKKAAFERALVKAKFPALLKQWRKLETQLAAIDKKIDKLWVIYQKSGEVYWGWRQKYKETYTKKHGREPAQYDVPPAINDDYIKKEIAFKKVLSFKRRERSFQEWTEERAAQWLREMTDAKRKKSIASIVSELKQRSPYQRLRCVALLRAVDAQDALRTALEKERDPVVAGEIAAAVRDFNVLARVLTIRPEWQTRAGAVRGLKAIRNPDSIETLVSHMPKQKGRLLDDFGDALRWLSGHDAGGNPDSWNDWFTDGFDPPPVPKPPKDHDERLHPTPVYSDGATTFFGIPTRSRNVVYCLAASHAWEHISGEAARSIASLPDGSLFNVVVCGVKPKRWKKKSMPANMSTKKAAADFMRKKIKPGGADICSGLIDALTLKADTIFFFALNGSSAGTVSDSPQIGQEIPAQNRIRGVRIHTVGVSEPRDAYFLQEIARQFGGEWRSPR